MSRVSTQETLKPISESMFYMWRCVICMAHADGIVHEKERELFDRIFANMGQVYDVSLAHAETFRRDIAAPQDIEKLLPFIADPECQSLLIFFSQVVACIDGRLDFQEAELIGQLYGAFGGKEDTAANIGAIRDDIAARMKLYEESGHERPERPATYYALDALLLRLGIDLLD
jgi:uncharacterized membrane protein YebE (DUF533 family)